MMGMFAAGLGVGLLFGDFAWPVALAGSAGFFVLSVPVVWVLQRLARRVVPSIGLDATTPNTSTAAFRRVV